MNFNTDENLKGLRFKIGNPKDLRFEIFANPRFSTFQFNKYKNIISKLSLGKQLNESNLKIFLDFRK